MDADIAKWQKQNETGHYDILIKDARRRLGLAEMRVRNIEDVHLPKMKKIAAAFQTLTMPAIAGEDKGVVV